MMPSHDQIRKVAEALARELAKDFDELAQFVEDTLTYQYKGNYECFVEDWQAYIGGPVDNDYPDG
jgi:hypothetical protein